MDIDEEDYINGFDVREFPDFKELDEKDILHFIKREWFSSYFEDPSYSMPRDGEGGFFYPYGGPYNAHHEIETVFEGFVSEEGLLKRIGRELEGEFGVLEWAPTDRHPDQVRLAEEHAAMAERYEVEYESWLKSTDPFAQLIVAHDELEEFITQQGSAAVISPLLRRMIFVQAWVHLEAYLYSKLLKSVREIPSALKNLCANDTTFSQKKFLAPVLLAEPNAVLNYVVEQLHTVSYHNLPKTVGLYSNAFGKLPVNETVSDGTIVFVSVDTPLGELQPLLPKRHDCVHRNGKTIRDEEIDVTIDEVKTVIRYGRLLAEQFETLVRYHKATTPTLD